MMAGSLPVAEPPAPESSQRRCRHPSHAAALPGSPSRLLARNQSPGPRGAGGGRCQCPPPGDGRPGWETGRGEGVAAGASRRARRLRRSDFPARAEVPPLPEPLEGAAGGRHVSQQPRTWPGEGSCRRQRAKPPCLSPPSGRERLVQMSSAARGISSSRRLPGPLARGGEGRGGGPRLQLSQPGSQSGRRGWGWAWGVPRARTRRASPAPRRAARARSLPLSCRRDAQLFPGQGPSRRRPLPPPPASCPASAALPRGRAKVQRRRRAG